jgi:hypothetical protein
MNGRASSGHTNASQAAREALVRTDDPHEARAIVVGMIMAVIDSPGIQHTLLAIKVKGIVTAYRQWQALRPLEGES